MIIKSINVYKKDLGNKRPYTIAFKTVDEVFSAILELELEDGTVAYGAGNPSQQVVNESVDDAIQALQSIDFIVGRDIRHFYSILSDVQIKLPKNPSARATLDIALHDAFTKYMDIPLAGFLGQQIKSLPTSVTIGIKNVEDTLAEADEYYDLGFKILKVKTGLDVDEDIERVKKLRERFGNHFKIRVDGNQGYDVEKVTKFYNSTLKDDVELIEQPIPAQQVDTLKSLPDAIKERIAADESLLSPYHAFRLAETPRASGIFNIKLMKAGGIQPARDIATIAQYSNTDLMWGCNDESAISIAAALHTALSFSNTRYLDLDGSLDVVEDVVKGGFTLKDGYLSILDKPGLGVYK